MTDHQSPITNPEQPKGLECPSCGCRDLRVYYTRPRHKYILRVRLCRHCGRKIATRETLPDGGKPKAA